MEEAVGFSVEEWKEYVFLYQQGLPKAGTGSLKQSNSIWLNEESELKIKQPFLQTITDYFGASVYQIPFDNKTRKEVNLRLSKETNGTIKEILPELSEEAVMEGFDREQADFNGIATLNLGNLYIEDIVQKTYIDVNKHGTSAGAATVIAALTAADIEEEPIYITFDRPFVYMILDRKTNMPIMIGTVMDIGS